MDNLRARARRRAAVENALGAAGQRIGHFRIGKGKFRAGKQVIGRIGRRTPRLSETNVERHQSAADMGQRAFEDDLARFVPVESEMDQRAYEAPALR